MRLSMSFGHIQSCSTEITKTSYVNSDSGCNFFPSVRQMCGPRSRGWSFTLALDTELWNLLLKMQNLEDVRPSHNPVKKLLLARSHY